MNAQLRWKIIEVGAPPRDDRWLAAFHAGDRHVIEGAYRDHYRAVAVTVGRFLSEADAETVIHEVFYRLLSDAALRENFTGGNFAGWLTRVATNSALDHRRRYRREQSHTPDAPGSALDAGDARDEARRVDDELTAKSLVERFRRDCLPPEWAAVFEARFLRHLSQRAAANELGIRRTTLAYQESRIRELLTQFLIRTEGR